MRILPIITACYLICCPREGSAQVTNLDREFAGAVVPFVKAYCINCHSGEKPKAKFDISPYTTVGSVIEDFGHWELVLDMLKEGEMPPDDEENQPSPEMRAEIVAWIQGIRSREAEKNAGDPGIVLARRLSNAEYDYTVRDLIGVDLQPTREFPIDPANEAGFDNSGESLNLSPALLKKYLEAARSIAAHLVLQPEGFAFAPHPVETDTDRDKYCVNRIVDFYKRQPVELADYFLAAWEYKQLNPPGAAVRSIDQIASESGLSPKYLHTVWELLSGERRNTGPIADLREQWNALPTMSEGTEKEVYEKCVEISQRVQALRRKLVPKIPFLKTRGIHTGSQAFVMWHNRQQADNRRSINLDALQPAGREAQDSTSLLLRDPELSLSGFEDEQAEQIAAFTEFCSVFPDAFFVSERGREFLDKAEETSKNEKGRLLSAGFHSMMGYFRDDLPLCELILSDTERNEIDALWQELDFVTSAPMRQHTGLVWFERTDSGFMRGEEFDFARAEDKEVTSEVKIRKLAEVYLAKAISNGADELAQEAIKEHFFNINESVRRVEAAREAARPSHIRALVGFAERAYRRPLTKVEEEDLVGFYRSQLESEGFDHENAIRDCVVSVLISPHFWYRIDLPGNELGIHPLPDLALASRLSYFLWSSMPDEELLAHAIAGDLHQPEVLIAQTRRMLRDSRVRGMAVEFGGNWLGFRQFENHNSVDRERFPSFTNELRSAMFEEPVQFFTHVVQENLPISDFLFADHTYVNPALAAHYGLATKDAAENQWTRINNVRPAGRGGLLPMSVFQTQNAPGLRTSPVKRGYWVVRQLLGEHIPPPPPNVPELPSDEGIGDLTLREQLVRHREDKNCAACHARFDSIGLAFEGYGPVGETRLVDLGGRPVDVHASFPGGGEGDGLDGLIDYLREYRREEFSENLCRKLFSYALGRTLLLSDDLMIETMKSKLEADGDRMHSLIETIVTSPQFLTKRGRVNLAKN